MLPPDFGNDGPNSLSQELERGMDAFDNVPSDGAPRENLITTATNFLLNPKINRDTENEQRAFLQRKGLTPVEIDTAFQRRMALMTGPAALAGFLSTPKRSKSWADTLHRFAMSVAVFGSASYALYWFFKTYVEPRLSQNRTEQILTEMLQEIKRKSETDAECAIKTMKAIAELRDEMAAMKRMLLARNQFPASPTPTGVPQAVKIPQWQQNHQTPTLKKEEVEASPPLSIDASAEKEESAPDSGISPEVTSSDGEPQEREVKDKPRSSKKKRGAYC
ncbi:peroxisomal membrane protein PEX14 [Galendromus occidentalis]|uniref:Peroxisomal membrane protein PEX14 n=1 Tax=Galendromus occidentalis TaxID=34638 RepID=A0AAJ6QVR8_9ACAR|nr:peroxisomal membrane protein PEX14 [Galendromus occidentalis]